MHTWCDMTTLQFRDDSRSILYYNKWRYVGHFFLEDAFIIRSLNKKKMEAMLQSPWVRRTSLENGTPIRNLRNMRDVLSSIELPYYRYVYHSWIYIYANDLQVFEQLDQVSYIDLFNLRQAKVDLPKGIIFLRKPQHQFRTYFREKRTEREQVQNFKDFLHNRPDIKASKPLRSMLINSYSYMRGWFYIDHNDPRDLIFVSMILPGMIRQTLPIQAK